MFKPPRVTNAAKGAAAWPGRGRQGWRAARDRPPHDRWPQGSAPSPLGTPRIQHLPQPVQQAAALPTCGRQGGVCTQVPGRQPGSSSGPRLGGAWPGPWSPDPRPDGVHALPRAAFGSSTAPPALPGPLAGALWGVHLPDPRSHQTHLRTAHPGERPRVPGIPLPPGPPSPGGAWPALRVFLRPQIPGHPPARPGDRVTWGAGSPGRGCVQRGLRASAVGTACLLPCRPQEHEICSSHSAYMHTCAHTHTYMYVHIHMHTRVHTPA